MNLGFGVRRHMTCESVAKVSMLWATGLERKISVPLLEFGMPFRPDVSEVDD